VADDPRDDLVPLAVAARTLRRDERTLRRWVTTGLTTREVDGTRYVTLRAATDWALRHGRRRGRAN
jgi:hypothetical protein